MKSSVKIKTVFCHTMYEFMLNNFKSMLNTAINENCCQEILKKNVFWNHYAIEGT